jgi:hypothetical protein
MVVTAAVKAGAEASRTARRAVDESTGGGE